MKLLYFLVVCIVFLGSFALGINVRAKEMGVKMYDIGGAHQLPVLAKSEAFPVLSGQGVIAVDADSNVTLYEKDADSQLYPASTTKIITALVSLDYYKEDQILTVKRVGVEGQKMGLVMNEQISFDSLINGLLIYSANDAAVTLADNYPGGYDAFVNAMNNKAGELNLKNTHFANPIGLDDASQVTTARDMVRLSEVAMKNTYFASIVGTRQKSVQSSDGKFKYDLRNINQLLGIVDGVKGIKTGWTEAAAENLVTYVERDGHKVYIALLGSQDRFGETKELIDWIYGNYEWKNIGFVSKAVGSLF